MAGKRARAKVRGNKNIYDEWEHGDIDRDDQKAGLKRRDRRWKQIELERKRQKALEKQAIDNIEKMDRGSKGRPLTELETAWLRCDFLLSNIMERKAYKFMEWQRVNDPDAYRRLYRKIMSRNMMEFAQEYVDYFAKGYKAPVTVSFPEIVRLYKKIKGIKTRIKLIHKGEDEYEL